MSAGKNIADGRFKALVVALAKCVALAAAMFLAIEGPFSAEAAHGGTADTHLEMSVAHADGGEAHPDHAICAPFAYCTGALAPAPTAKPCPLSREVGRLKAAAAWRLDGWADDPRLQPPKS